MQYLSIEKLTCYYQGLFVFFLYDNVCKLVSSLDKGFGIWQRVCGLSVLCATLGDENLLSEMLHLLKGVMGGQFVAFMLVSRCSCEKSNAKKKH